MGRAVLSKSFIQFSVDGCGCVPFLLFDLRPNSCGGNDDNSKLLQKVPCMHCCTQCSQPPAGHPCLCWRFLDTHGQVWVNLLWGHCSFLLGSAMHKVLFVPSTSPFPQSCVSPGGCIMWLIVTSSKRAYAIPKSAASRAHAPVAVHC